MLLDEVEQSCEPRVTGAGARPEAIGDAAGVSAQPPDGLRTAAGERSGQGWHEGSPRGIGNSRPSLKESRAELALELLEPAQQPAEALDRAKHDGAQDDGAVGRALSDELDSGHALRVTAQPEA